MKRFTLTFIILVGLLFLGVVIMIKPSIFVSPSMPYHITTPDHPLADRIVPKAIMISGSALTVIGVVGLSVLGFMIFREIEHKDTRR